MHSNQHGNTHFLLFYVFLEDLKVSDILGAKVVNVKNSVIMALRCIMLSFVNLFTICALSDLCDHKEDAALSSVLLPVCCITAA